MKENNSSNKLTIVLFFIYLIALVWILLFKLGVQFSYVENRTVNLIPFNDLISNGKLYFFGEIIMNIIIFVPLGIYAGILFKKWNFGKNLMIILLLSFFVEFIQFIFKLGSFDITDTITNTLGGIIGLLVFIVIEKVFKNKAKKFINIIAVIGTGLMILFLVLLKTDNLWLKYH